jgi:hypothetical protein
MDNYRARHARIGARAFVIALLGIALATSTLALAPANAAGIRTDTAPATPAIVLPGDTVLRPVMAGAGSIAGPVGLTCSNLAATTTAPVPCADPLTLGELGKLTSALDLVAAPAPGWEFTGWTGCTGATSGDTCQLTIASLTSLLTAAAPVANFLPIGGDPALPGACESPLPVPGSDCSAPVTKITTSPAVTADKLTKEKTASFAFAAYEADSSGNATTTPTTGATFECELVGPGQTAGFSACSSPKSYENLADGEYTFAVRASDTASPPNVDATPEKFTWRVQTAPPNTVITRGPSRWALAKTATFGLAISPAGTAKYRCSLDGVGRLCTGSSTTLAFAAGTHTFAVQGTDSLGNEDPTAATRTFTLPVNNSDLSASKGWKKGKGAGYFLKTFSVTTKKGATLTRSATGIKRVALVASKGKGYGTVNVYLGKKLLKKVSLAAKTTKKSKVINVASFTTATSGKLKLVVTSQNKKVVIEGLGIATR